MKAIALTTPFDPGDLDTGKTYTHVRIKSVKIDLENSAVELDCEHGYYDDETWVAGKRFKDLTRKSHILTGDDFSGLFGSLLQTAFHQKLLDKTFYVGEVE